MRFLHVTATVSPLVEYSSNSSSSLKLAQCDNIDLKSEKLSYINESISDNCTFLSAALRARSRFPFYAFLYASFLSNFLILQVDRVPFKKVQIRKITLDAHLQLRMEKIAFFIYAVTFSRNLIADCFCEGKKKGRSVLIAEDCHIFRI